MTNYASQGGGAMTLYESNAMPLHNAQHWLGAAPYAAGGGLMSLYMGGADGAMTNYSAGGAVAVHNYVTNYTMSAQAMVVVGCSESEETQQDSCDERKQLSAADIGNGRRGLHKR